MYSTVADIHADPQLRRRMTACAAVEGVTGPEQWVADHAWQLAAQPGWAAAWESAIASHPDDPEYQPGRDEAVITDGMVLSAVRAIASGAQSS